MLQHFKHLYGDGVRDEALGRFGFEAVSLETLPEASHSYVYECRRDGGLYVLKVTHSVHRRAENVRGELEFINFLADGGVSVPRAVRSLGGRFVERIGALEGEFVAVAYEKAAGELVDWRDWTPGMFERWGALIGRMHAIGKGYEPSDEGIRRRYWHEDTDWDVDAEVYRERPEFRAKAMGVRDWLLSLPTDGDCFGLVHSDLHQWNFNYADGVILPFDFDNTHYDWFIADFTTVVINAVVCQQYHYGRGEYEYWSGGTPMDADAFLEYFFTPFIEGYRAWNVLDGVWLRRMPAFLNRHWLTFLTDALRDPGFGGLSAEEQAGSFPWRTLGRAWDEVMGDYWSRFDFGRYA